MRQRRLPDRYTKARQAAEAIVDIVPRTADPNDDSFLYAAIKDALTRAYANGALNDVHPILLQATLHKRRELELKQAALQLAAERTAAYLRESALREEQMRFHLDQLTKPETEKVLTADDHSRIRAIFGLNDAPEPPLSLGPSQQESFTESLDPDTEADRDSPSD